jgi:DegV family protein with EDD domain
LIYVRTICKNRQQILYYAPLKEEEGVMPKIQLVSDTAHNLPDEILRTIPMIEVPFEIVVGDEVFKDKSLTLAALARLLERRKGKYPSTNAPPPWDFYQAYRASQESDGVLVVTIGGGFSATYKNAHDGVELFREQTSSDLPIEIVDSKSGTVLQGLQIMEANRLITAGNSLEDVASRLRTLAEKDNLVFALRETTYLYRSGRAKALNHLLGSVLRIKPVLALNDGKLGLLDRVRGHEEKALARVAQEVLERSGGSIDQLAVVGGLDTEGSESFVTKEILKGLSKPPSQVFSAKMCAAIMVHVGPHGVGAAWV